MALSFSGSNFLVNHNKNSGGPKYSPASGGLTISGWYKTSSTSVVIACAGTDNSGTNTFDELIMEINSTGHLDANTRIGGADNKVAVTPTSNDGSWHHGAAVVSNTNATISIYQDGANKASASTGGFVNPIICFSIATLYFAGGNANFNGSIADVGCWVAALTDQEVYALAHGSRPNQIRPNGFASFYPLSGYNAQGIDLGPFNLPLFASGTPALVTGPPLVNASPIVGPQNVKTTAAAAASVVFRRTLTAFGTRAGSRQQHGFA